MSTCPRSKDTQPPSSFHYAICPLFNILIQCFFLHKVCGCYSATSLVFRLLSIIFYALKYVCCISKSMICQQKEKGKEELELVINNILPMDNGRVQPHLF